MTDASDEALAAMCDDAADDILGELFAGQNHKGELVQMLINLVTETRDLTAARCVEACKERARTRGVDPAKPPFGFTFGDHVTAMGVESLGCAELIGAIFPGAAAAEGEARDG